MFLQDISFDEDDVTKNVFVDYGIRSDNLNPHRITSELEIKPSKAYAKGEKYQGRVVNPITKEEESTWRERWTGIWAIDTKGVMASKKVEQHVQFLLDLLEPKKEIINRYLTDRDEFQIRFYIWWEPYFGHGSYAISNDTLKKMSDLCHYIEFGVLCTDDEE